MSEKPRKIIQREMMTNPTCSGISAIDLIKVHRSMYEARASVRPPQPKTLDKLHEALSAYSRTTTNEDEHFLLINDAI